MAQYQITVDQELLQGCRRVSAIGIGIEPDFAGASHRTASSRTIRTH